MTATGQRRSRPWTANQIRRLHATKELEIASRRRGGSLRPYLPIWVVTVDDQVYVRTWYRRSTGWYGHALKTGQARIRVQSIEADVAIADLGNGGHALRAVIDHAYQAKYGPDGGGALAQMITDDAAATTLRLLTLALATP